MTPNRLEQAVVALLLAMAGALAILMVVVVGLVAQAVGWWLAGGLAAVGVVTVAGLIWMTLSGDFPDPPGDFKKWSEPLRRTPRNRL